MDSVLLNVAHIQLRSRVNGPGLRSVVWVQGCTIGCPGCFNPHTHAHESRRLLEPQAMAQRLLRLPDTDGVTISGGEPFQQAAGCAVLAQAVRTAGRSVVVFTGYSYSTLRSSTSPAVRCFLAEIDLLIAGPYVEALKTDGSGWLASANQQIHRLSNRMTEPDASAGMSQPVVELTMNGNQLNLTGFPDRQDLGWLDQLLRKPVIGCPTGTAETGHRQREHAPTCGSGWDGIELASDARGNSMTGGSCEHERSS